MDGEAAAAAVAAAAVAVGVVVGAGAAGAGAPAVVVVGLNAAVQKTLVMRGAVRRGGVNRAASAPAVSAGGKGQQFFRMARALARRVEPRWAAAGAPRLVQVLGGARGRLVEGLLSEGGRPAAACTVWAAAETRVCTTLLHEGEATEVVEPGAPLTAQEAASAMAEAVRVAGAPGVAGVALMGSCPPGTPRQLLAEVAMAKPAGAWLLVDGIGAEARLALATCRCDVLKINLDELAALDGGGGRPAGAAAALAWAFDTAAAVLERHSLQMVALTDGPRLALLVQPGGVQHAFAVPPPAKAVVNPIGAGDAAAAALLYGLVAGDGPVRAWRRALAVATAACAHADAAATLSSADVAAVEDALRVFPRAESAAALAAASPPPPPQEQEQQSPPPPRIHLPLQAPPPPPPSPPHAHAPPPPHAHQQAMASILAPPGLAGGGGTAAAAAAAAAMTHAQQSEARAAAAVAAATQAEVAGRQPLPAWCAKPQLVARRLTQDAAHRHMMVESETNPETGRRLRRWCAVCSFGRPRSGGRKGRCVYSFCDTCDTYLCRRAPAGGTDSCFVLWHTVKDLMSLPRVSEGPKPPKRRRGAAAGTAAAAAGAGGADTKRRRRGDALGAAAAAVAEAAGMVELPMGHGGHILQQGGE